MKQMILKATLVLATAALPCGVMAADSQETIVYVHGPSFAVPSVEEAGGGSLDLNADGVPDFNFSFGYFLCTADVPSSGCSLTFDITAGGLSGAQVEKGTSQPFFVPFGQIIGETTTSNAAWSPPGLNIALSSYFFSPRYGTRGYGGRLTQAGIGYLGVRLLAADGPHYGWVRVRSPMGAEFAPVVVDWAYEGRANTPLGAGIIGASAESLQFKATCKDQNGELGIGTFILTDGLLRAEVNMAEAHSVAVIAGPAPAGANAKPAASLGLPLAARTNYTAFFREISLQHSSIVRMLHEKYYLSVDDGELLGQIRALR
jgi:hypothetical protein